MGQSTADVFDAARSGESGARAIAEDAASWFGRGLYNVAVALDTRMFVVGGSVWQHPWRVAAAHGRRNCTPACMR